MRDCRNDDPRALGGDPARSGAGASRGGLARRFDSCLAMSSPRLGAPFRCRWTRSRLRRGRKSAGTPLRSSSSRQPWAALPLGARRPICFPALSLGPCRSWPTPHLINLAAVEPGDPRRSRSSPRRRAGRCAALGVAGDSSSPRAHLVRRGGAIGVAARRSTMSKAPSRPSARLLLELRRQPEASRPTVWSTRGDPARSEAGRIASASHCHAFAAAHWAPRCFETSWPGSPALGPIRSNACTSRFGRSRVRKQTARPYREENWRRGFRQGARGTRGWPTCDDSRDADDDDKRDTPAT